MIEINSKTTQRFCELAAKELKGDWVILGGSVMVLLGVKERFTVDIGLAPEAINQAGAFFLNRIPNWKDNLVPICLSSNLLLRNKAKF
ncbi:MAG: hypothetical protein ACKOA8_17945 [Deltaproteobacteria bacterium]